MRHTRKPHNEQKENEMNYESSSIISDNNFNNINNSTNNNIYDKDQIPQTRGLSKRPGMIKFKANLMDFNVG